MVNNYNLVNPYVRGKIETSIKAKNSNDAASIIYTNLSDHFNNSIPAFYFTLQKGGGKFYHFKVTEKRQKNEINFKINEIQLDNNNYIKKEFQEKLDNIKNKIEEQEGGDRKHKKSKKKSKKSSKKSSRKSSKKSESESSDSDSSSDYSSDSDDLYIRSRRNYFSDPLYYWWYDPLVYILDKLYLPTFYSYITPYIHLDSTIVTKTITTRPSNTKTVISIDP